MTKYFFALLLMASAIFMSPAFAADEPSLSQSLSDIMASQQVSQASDILCNTVTDDQFAELGDAFMATRHPDAREHEYMDTMMGGEGSDSLRAAHISMGQAYLGCGVDGNTKYGMMGSSFGGMMGYGYGVNVFSWVTMLLVWTVLVLAIILLVKNVSRKK